MIPAPAVMFATHTGLRIRILVSLHEALHDPRGNGLVYGPSFHRAAEACYPTGRLVDRSDLPVCVHVTIRRVKTGDTGRHADNVVME